MPWSTAHVNQNIRNGIFSFRFCGDNIDFDSNLFNSKFSLVTHKSWKDKFSRFGIVLSHNCWTHFHQIGQHMHSTQVFWPSYLVIICKRAPTQTSNLPRHNWLFTRKTQHKKIVKYSVETSSQTLFKKGEQQRTGNAGIIFLGRIWVPRYLEVAGNQERILNPINSVSDTRKIEHEEWYTWHLAAA